MGEDRISSLPIRLSFAERVSFAELSLLREGGTPFAESDQAVSATGGIFRQKTGFIGSQRKAPLLPFS